MADDNVIQLPPAKPAKGSPEMRAKMQALAARSKANREERKRLGLTNGYKRLRPLTDKEVRDRALQTAADLFDQGRKAAVDLLLVQMDHKDPMVAQRAAIKVLEYTDGKPNQPITARTDNITTVVYETAALAPAGFQPGFGLEETG